MRRHPGSAFLFGPSTPNPTRTHFAPLHPALSLHPSPFCTSLPDPIRRRQPSRSTSLSQPGPCLRPLLLRIQHKLIIIPHPLSQLAIVPDLPVSPQPWSRTDAGSHAHPVPEAGDLAPKPAAHLLKQVGVRDVGVDAERNEVVRRPIIHFNLDVRRLPRPRARTSTRGRGARMWAGRDGLRRAVLRLRRRGAGVSRPGDRARVVPGSSTSAAASAGPGLTGRRAGRVDGR